MSNLRVPNSGKIYYTEVTGRAEIYWTAPERTSWVTHYYDEALDTVPRELGGVEFPLLKEHPHLYIEIDAVLAYRLMRATVASGVKCREMLEALVWESRAWDYSTEWWAVQRVKWRQKAAAVLLSPICGLEKALGYLEEYVKNNRGLYVRLAGQARKLLLEMEIELYATDAPSRYEEAYRASKRVKQIYGVVFASDYHKVPPLALYGGSDIWTLQDDGSLEASNGLHTICINFGQIGVEYAPMLHPMARLNTEAGSKVGKVGNVSAPTYRNVFGNDPVGLRTQALVNARYDLFGFIEAGIAVEIPV
jgi:hypothetical protein